jgi:hypothetical protein
MKKDKIDFSETSRKRKGAQPGNLTKTQQWIFARGAWRGLYKSLARMNAYNEAHPAKPLPEIAGGQ